MPRDERMFGDVVSPSIGMGHRQGRSVTATILLEAVLVGAVITIPLMATDALPAAPDMMGAFVAPTPPPAPPPPPAAPRSSSSASPSKPVVVVDPDAAPIVAPATVEPETPPVNACFDCGGTSDVPNLGGGNGDPDGGVPGAPPAPPAPVPPRTVTPKVVHVGGNVQAPRKIRDVKPVYPLLAQQARREGYVILEATIDAGGRVTDVHVLRSVPLLDEAAIDAVKQWQFTPTLLNGEPTSVIMNVTVNFRLN